MRLKFAFLGTWHSHASMHVREAANRPDEVELLGMYDPNADVIAHCQERFSEWVEDVPVFEFEEAVLESDADAVVVEGHVYQNLDYAERALEAAWRREGCATGVPVGEAFRWCVDGFPAGLF